MKIRELIKLLEEREELLEKVRCNGFQVSPETRDRWESQVEEIEDKEIGEIQE